VRSWLPARAPAARNEESGREYLFASTHGSHGSPYSSLGMIHVVVGIIVIAVVVAFTPVA
jgi:hypothetical protein